MYNIKEDGSTDANTYSYQDENGVNQLVIYKYLKDRGWVFMVRNSAAAMIHQGVCRKHLICFLHAQITAAAVFFFRVLTFYFHYLISRFRHGGS